ncbi:hypothetical protein [Brevundimonas sp.]|uniref:hypothetical protein n=1 Tax=Brevundimonas sp. TaxID=1871086 RepID=UPI0035B2043C
MIDPIERRSAIDSIDAYFRPGIETDEEQATVLQVERARLTLYGSLAALAGALTALMATDKKVSEWIVGAGLMLLFVGAVIAWTGLTHAQTFRYQRGIRRNLERQAALHARFGPDNKVFGPVSDKVLQKARDDELKTNRRIGSATMWSSICVMFGGCALLTAAMESLEQPVAKKDPSEVSAKASDK